jgi:hypothetical protein
MRNELWKVTIGVLVVVSLLGGFGAPAAALSLIESKGEKVVYDEINQKFWYWDIYFWSDHTFEEMTENIKTELADGYFRGSLGWHMATADDLKVWESYTIEEMESTFGYQRFQSNDQIIVGETLGYMNIFGADSDGPTEITDAMITGWSYNNGAWHAWKGASLGKYWEDFSHPSLGAWVVADATNSTPVPEPGTLFLLILGLFSFWASFHSRR